MGGTAGMGHHPLLLVHREGGAEEGTVVEVPEVQCALLSVTELAYVA